MTVVKAKSLRLQSAGEEKTQDTSSQQQKEISATSPFLQMTFDIPDNTSKIDELTTILQSYAGDQEIVVGNQKFLLTQEGIEKIRILLAK